MPVGDEGFQRDPRAEVGVAELDVRGREDGFKGEVRAGAGVVEGAREEMALGVGEVGEQSDFGGAVWFEGRLRRGG